MGRREIYPGPMLFDFGDRIFGEIAAGKCPLSDVRPNASEIRQRPRKAEIGKRRTEGQDAENQGAGTKFAPRLEMRRAATHKRKSLVFPHVSGPCGAS